MTTEARATPPKADEVAAPRPDAPAAPPTPAEPKAAPQTEAEREYEIGKRLLEDPSPSGLRAPDHLKRACDADHAGACNDLGWAYDTGFGALAEDDKKAAELFELACDLGSARACLNRGVMARSTNLAKAAEYAARACDDEMEEACVKLSGIVNEAKTACEKKPKDCANWGLIQSRGFGVTQDRAAALASYERACTAGDDVGCFNAGIVLRDGTAGRADRAKAKLRFQTACKRGYDSGCRQAELLGQR